MWLVRTSAPSRPGRSRGEDRPGIILGIVAMVRDGARTDALDLDLLARQTLGDRELEAELFALFEAQADRLWPVISGEGGRKERSEAAHSLKGGAAGVGAVAVMRHAGEIETALAGPGQEPAASLAALAAALAEARRAIAAWRAAG